MRACRITAARGWEARHVARVLWACLEDAAWLPRVRTAREERLLIAGMIRRGEVRVARRAGQIVGFLALDGAGEVLGLYVRPEDQGQGIARALLRDAKLGRGRIALWAHAANTPARRFYHAEGFRPMAVGAGNDERLTEIRYEWERAA